jgi:hypothetical protein
VPWSIEKIDYEETANGNALVFRAVSNHNPDIRLDIQLNFTASQRQMVLAAWRKELLSAGWTPPAGLTAESADAATTTATDASSAPENAATGSSPACAAPAPEATPTGKPSPC